MRAGGAPGKPPRRSGPFRHIRKAAKRWRRRIGIRLGLLPGPARRGYMICATPRSGSSYLCQLLASTHLLGNPLEYFNTAGRRFHTDPKYPASPRAQLDIIRSMGATPNGIYAVKLLAGQLRRIGDAIDPFRDLPDLTLVRLGRRDLLGQAISLARARQTGQFIASDPAITASTYSEKRIRYCLRLLREQEATWDRIMAELGVQPLTFAYEDILRDPQHVVDRIAALMGFAPPMPIDRALITHTVQRDENSNAWRRQFLAETRDEFRHLAGCE